MVSHVKRTNMRYVWLPRGVYIIAHAKCVWIWQNITVLGRDIMLMTVETTTMSRLWLELWFVGCVLNKNEGVVGIKWYDLFWRERLELIILHHFCHVRYKYGTIWDWWNRWMNCVCEMAGAESQKYNFSASLEGEKNCETNSLSHWEKTDDGRRKRCEEQHTNWSKASFLSWRWALNTW